MTTIRLPEPVLKGQLSVEEAVRRRRSRRSFAEEPLATQHLGQLLWAAQGITDAQKGRRAAPSAGATYPMKVFVAVGLATVGDLEAGVYRYVPSEHSLAFAFGGDVREQVAQAALGQDFLAAAAADVLLAADHGRTSGRYGERARRYVAMEAGHISQNISLQAEALGLWTVAVGAFTDDAVSEVFRLSAPLEPLYLMPVGRAR
ncbi:MAG: hypothetical protein AMK73_07665 [Planctomycetes bacterium SM23_32]|nr:MAG: hypothetical protein AMK73_07665 [Planctomycetes bacterium SM23_32]